MKNEKKKWKMKNNKWENEKAKGLSILLGGGQVDGLPPAASHEALPLLEE